MENTLVFKIGVEEIDSESVSLIRNSYREIEFEFEPGEHTFTTDIIPSSNAFGNAKVIMELKMPYSYYPDENSIFLCGAGYSGINHNSVVLRNMENREILGECKNNKYGNNSKEKVDFCGTETFNAVRDMLNDISERLVKIAEEKGLMVYVRKDLYMSAEEEEAFSHIGLLFKAGELKGFYDSETECNETYKRVPVTSFPGGTVLVPVKQQFWNVQGSTGDPKHGAGSWIGFWRTYSGDPLNGCTNGLCVNFNNPNQGTMVGGHIVFNKNAVNPMPGCSGVVAILPICRTCNHVGNIGAMQAGRMIHAVWLNLYHN